MRHRRASAAGFPGLLNFISNEFFVFGPAPATSSPQFVVQAGPASKEGRGLVRIPACWLVSLVVHSSIFLAAALLLGSAPRGGSLAPHTFETILLGDGEGNGWTHFETPGSTPGASASPEPPQPPQAAQPDPPIPAREPVHDLPPPPLTLSGPAVPSVSAASSGSTAPPGGNANSGGSESGFGAAGGSRFGLPGAGGTSLFGIPSDGKKIVYVFDRSTSMGGGVRSPLSMAKAELLASLDQLAETDQFQVVFYNSSPTPFALPKQAPRLVPATPINRNLVRSFLGGIIADGGTAHEEALTLALRMGPDTIFFLTDADQPVLNPGQLERISRLNRRQTVIHVIEFGRGPSLGDLNFLVRIAQQNYGKYTYVDVTRPELYLAEK